MFLISQTVVQLNEKIIYAEKLYHSKYYIVCCLGGSVDHKPDTLRSRPLHHLRSSYLGGRRMDDTSCPYEAQRKMDQKTLTIHCRDCEKGNSTVCDIVCRRKIFQILQKEHGIDHLILDHVLVKVFAGEELKRLQDLLSFIQRLEAYRHTRVPCKEFLRCAACAEKRKQELWSLIDEALNDPIFVFFKLHEMRENLAISSSPCAECEEKYKAFLSEIISMGELQHLEGKTHCERRVLYDSYQAVCSTRLH